LKETKRESGVRGASDPKTEVIMDLDTLGEKKLFHLLHEIDGQMAVVEY